MTEHWRALQVGDCCELLARLKEGYDVQHDRLAEMAAEIERLRARVAEFEAAISAAAALSFGTMGTLQQPTPDEPATITHNVPPSAPPHGCEDAGRSNPQPPIGHTIKWPTRTGDDNE